MGSILRSHDSLPVHGRPLTEETAGFLEAFTALPAADQIEIFGIAALKFLDALDAVLAAMGEALEASRS